MNKTTLVIMAAGIGSRYGGGIKQLEKVGPCGEIIMDYSIYDAIRAGFQKVVFIIRRDLEKEFKEIIGNRIEKQIEVEYVYQELSNIPEGYEVPENRKKPWGTGQAILSCKGIVKEPFAVINADDYYGSEAFLKMNEFLQKSEGKKNAYAMVGFILGNTLSDNGIVTRGVCKVDPTGYLSDIEETFAIKKDGEAAIGEDGNQNPVRIPLDSSVSMNMWGFTPEFLEELEGGFVKFLSSLSENKEKAEYLLPGVVGDMLKEGRATVKVLKSSDKWFGVTYKEDKQLVVDSINALIQKGVYPARLFS